MTKFGRKKAANKATEQPAREETSRECSARRRERGLKNGRNITAYVSYRSLFNIMLPVWEATLDEIESKLLDLSALQMRSLCEMLKLNVGEGETHTPRVTFVVPNVASTHPSQTLNGRRTQYSGCLFFLLSSAEILIVSEEYIKMYY